MKRNILLYIPNWGTTIHLLLRTTLTLGLWLLSICHSNAVQAQLNKKSSFTAEDSLRGSLNLNRTWWNVLHYNISVQPNLSNKTIEGNAVIEFAITGKGKQMQIDLQQPMQLTKVIAGKNIAIPFKKQSANTWLLDWNAFKKLSIGKTQSVTLYFSGKPNEAKNAPWDGGWIWKKDKKGRPFVSVAVQGLGASSWFPCKDHQSDEPENGATLTLMISDSLTAVANGKRLKQATDSTKIKTVSWSVQNPINNYCIVPYIGNYVSFSDTLMGLKGKLDITYWVLDYNLEKAQKHFEQVKPMLRAFEYWFGPYPFYEDGYQLVEAPHLGMEHQSAIAYGNGFINGYRGNDLSATGWGNKWDFIIVHESGHEWFANSITSQDIADMWIHEGFTCYSETLFTEYYYGKEAANQYNKGLRRNISNDEPIIGIYGVNKEGSGDMYMKAANMIHSIRHSLNNDEKFRQLLLNINKTFYHQTVTTAQIEDFMIQQLGYNYQPVLNQYLRTTQIPQLEYYFNKDTLFYRYTNCIPNFNLPIVLPGIRIDPNTQWQQQTNINPQQFNSTLVETYYYVVAKQVAQAQ
jgi:aminopeptidase N